MSPGFSVNPEAAYRNAQHSLLLVERVQVHGITCKGYVEIGNISHTCWTDSLVIKASHSVLRDIGFDSLGMQTSSTSTYCDYGQILYSVSAFSTNTKFSLPTFSTILGYSCAYFPNIQYSITHAHCFLIVCMDILSTSSHSSQLQFFILLSSILLGIFLHQVHSLSRHIHCELFIISNFQNNSLHPLLLTPSNI